ncbi:MAG: GNAT family N-acetyltransferase [Gammaproteobacteria bacterium]|nr:GNAT family N-acetyltransferase [Gammaproteobacteria bacterium]
MIIHIAESDSDINDTYPVMRELRPHINEQEYLQRIRHQGLDGYQLCFIREVQDVVAVAGFRSGDNLAWGHYLYVDDLVVLPEHRSMGYGKALLDWLREYARQQGCEQLHLDSGFQRKDAHRFYEREGMKSEGYHFSEMIDLNKEDN